MNKRIYGAALLGLAIVGAGCSGGGATTKSTAAGAVAVSSTTPTITGAAKWTADEKAGVRQVAAIEAQGPQLDCAVNVITGIYSPDDWTFVVAHPTVNGDESQLPARIQELNTDATQALAQRCGIKGAS